LSGDVTLLRALVGRWRWMALAALCACAVTVRLGVWQLDRLAARREVNAHLARRLTTQPAALDDLLKPGLPDGDARRDLELRPVRARGVWDYALERALPNQVWQGELGLHLITPLRLEGSGQVVLVDRGWIPGRLADPTHWRQFREPTGEVAEIEGWIRFEQRGLTELRRQVETAGLATLPLYVVLAPPAGAAGASSGQRLPYKQTPLASIGEGVHAIAAAQWFIISAIILIGLPVFVRRQTVDTVSPTGASFGAKVRGT
jgi:surfeit locus 1 family protein